MRLTQKLAFAGAVIRSESCFEGRRAAVAAPPMKCEDESGRESERECPARTNSYHGNWSPAAMGALPSRPRAYADRMKRSRLAAGRNNSWCSGQLAIAIAGPLDEAPLWCRAAVCLIQYKPEHGNRLRAGGRKQLRNLAGQLLSLAPAWGL
jgi:hypothetical protein